jgi:hypothetical protein
MPQTLGSVTYISFNNKHTILIIILEQVKIIRVCPIYIYFLEKMTKLLLFHFEQVEIINI